MSFHGRLLYFLEIEFSSTSHGFFIPQEKYNQDLLARAVLGRGCDCCSMFNSVPIMLISSLIRRDITIWLGALSILLTLV